MSDAIARDGRRPIGRDTAQPPASLSGQLMEVLARRPVSERDLEMTALFTLDAVAGIVGAQHHLKAQPITRWLAAEGGGISRMAMRLGALSNILEMDSMHRASAIHAGTVVVPAALAVGQALGSDGRRVLTAILKGCEAAYRIGRAVGPAHYRTYQNTATVGPFGAAVAAGLLMELSASEMVHALGNAGSQSGGFWEFLSDGALTKQLHAGGSAERGVAAAQLAQRGFTGPARILEGDRAFFHASCPDGDPDAVLRSPDAPWELWDNSYKPWPSPRHTHPTIDAALELAGLIEGRSIRGVEVDTYQTALDLCDEPSPTNEHQARFSLRHCAVIALLDGRVSFASFEDAAIRRAAGLVGRTTVRAAEPFRSAYPRAWGAEICVTLENGEGHVRRREHAKGDPEAPMSPAEMTAKAAELLRMGGVANVDALIGQVMAMVRGSPVPDFLAVGRVGGAR
jgi:2-methylcitrate dehydratase PrpD